MQPIRGSTGSVASVALAVAVGIFIGLTPTFGIQMWLVTTTWLAGRYLFNVSFDLIVGNSIVWISNPVTLFPLYYLFLKTGQGLRELLGTGATVVPYHRFVQELSSIIDNPEAGPFDIFLTTGGYLVTDVGVPIVFGSLVYAVPISLLAYFVTYRLLQHNRQSDVAGTWAPPAEER